MQSIETRCERMAGRGFTLLELIAVIAIISLLISLLAPALSNYRREADKAMCQTHLRRFGMAFMEYVVDHNGYMPDNRWWRAWGTRSARTPDPQIPYYLGYNPRPNVGGDARQPRCPDFPPGISRDPWWNMAYSYNAHWHRGNSRIARRLSEATAPTATIVLMDGVGATVWGPPRYITIGDYMVARHGSPEPSGNNQRNTVGTYANILYGDGRVEGVIFGRPPVVDDRQADRMFRLRK